jgi:hypothetical protein
MAHTQLARGSALRGLFLQRQQGAGRFAVVVNHTQHQRRVDLCQRARGIKTQGGSVSRQFGSSRRVRTWIRDIALHLATCALQTAEGGRAPGYWMAVAWSKTSRGELNFKEVSRNFEVASVSAQLPLGNFPSRGIRAAPYPGLSVQS